MKSFNVYLAFNGRCEEALNFYKGCFGGEINYMQRFGDAPTEMPDADKDKIMHAQLQVDDIVIMASDGNADFKATSGNQISLNMNFDSKDEQVKVFDKLKEGGLVQMELQDTFWGAHFGMLTDKYGITWMLNSEL